MPQLISKYRIFIASPSDLVEEREAIDEVISELNLTYGNPNNLVLELLKWETNSAPGVSNEEVQSLINSDIPEYDLFIGLLWMRFGTPTKKYRSGTEEEFQIAHHRFKEEQQNVQILIYFKNSPPQRLDDINPDQLLKVRAFKASLGEKDILHWEFNLKEELQRFLRIHIRARIETLRNAVTTEITTEKIQPDLHQIEIFNEEELGILDYQELIEESFAISTHSLNAISNATSWVGEEMNKKTAEVNKLVAKNRNQPISVKVQRGVLERTATVMNDFANRIDPEIPIYISHFEKGIDSFSKLANIYKLDFDDKADEIYEAKISLEGLLNQISGTLVNMNDFLLTVESLPRMSKELNSARRNVTLKLRDLLDRLEISLSIANEVHKNM